MPIDVAAPLTSEEQRMLDFAGLWFRYQGRREAAIVEQFNVDPTRFHQRLNALIDRHAALAYAPALVNRLRDERARRRIKRQHTFRRTTSTPAVLR